jgi:hypothetical protein
MARPADQDLESRISLLKVDEGTHRHCFLPRNDYPVLPTKIELRGTLPSGLSERGDHGLLRRILGPLFVELESRWTAFATQQKEPNS